MLQFCQSRTVKSLLCYLKSHCSYVLSLISKHVHVWFTFAFTFVFFSTCVFFTDIGTCWICQICIKFWNFDVFNFLGMCILFTRAYPRSDPFSDTNSISGNRQWCPVLSNFIRFIILLHSRGTSELACVNCLAFYHIVSCDRRLFRPDLSNACLLSNIDFLSCCFLYSHH